MNRIILLSAVLLSLYNPLFAFRTLSSNEAPRVVISPIRYGHKLLDYRLFLNGERVFVGQEITNLWPGQEYEFTVIDEHNRKVHWERSLISSRPRQCLVASEEWPQAFYPRVSIMGGNWLSGGVDYFISRYTWLGAGTGASYWYRSDIAASFFLVTPYLEYGTYFVGDRTSKWRVGLGGRINFHLGFPYQSWEDLAVRLDPDSEVHDPSSLSVEMFSTTEYGVWVLNLALRMDFKHPRFQFLPSVGMKF